MMFDIFWAVLSGYSVLVVSVWCNGSSTTVLSMDSRKIAENLTLQAEKDVAVDKINVSTFLSI